VSSSPPATGADVDGKVPDDGGKKNADASSDGEDSSSLIVTLISVASIVTFVFVAMVSTRAYFKWRWRRDKRAAACGPQPRTSGESMRNRMSLSMSALPTIGGRSRQGSMKAKRGSIAAYEQKRAADQDAATQAYESELDMKRKKRQKKRTAKRLMRQQAAAAAGGGDGDVDGAATSDSDWSSRGSDSDADF
jgi:hypothetical protein